MAGVRLPAGYLGLDTPHARGFARGDAVAWARRVLDSGSGLHEWAAGQGTAAGPGGRGRVHSVAAAVEGPRVQERWAVRRYRRGGAVARLLGERYLRVGEGRPFQELAASSAARARGVPTPPVVAGAVYPNGVFYRADLVTELIPGARELADMLFGPSRIEQPTALDALREAGRLLRLLEEARVVHRDLNATNVLLTRTAGRHQSHVLDLDRCRVLALDAPRPGPGMRRRLRRSLEKLGRVRGPELDHRAWAALAEGLEETR